MSIFDREELAKNAWKAYHDSIESYLRRKGEDVTFEMLRKILGEDCPESAVFFNRPMAEKLMKEQEWEKRIAGLLILGWYCKDVCQRDAESIEDILHLSNSDKCEQVRGVALHTLGRIMEGSRNQGVGNYLSTLVIDIALSRAIRESAYIGLCGLHGVTLPINYVPGGVLQQLDAAVLQYYL